MVDFLSFTRLVTQIGLGIFLFFAISIFLSWRWGAPWVTTPQKRVSRMLELAELKSGEKLVDLGAGDGRIVIAAAKEYKAEAIGIEIDPVRCALANIFILLKKLNPRPQVVWGNMYDFDLSDADVVTVFLTRESNDRLLSNFEKYLKQGSRVVSYSFPIKAWTPVLIDDTNLIFVYQIDQTGEDTQVTFV